MSKSLSAKRSRAPTSAGSGIAPANQVEVEGFEAASPAAAAPAAPRRKPRRVTALPPLISNLGAGKEACAGHRFAVATLDGAVLNHAADRLFTYQRCREILLSLVEEEGLLRQKTAEQRRLLERERDELGKRLERWYERIETDADLADVGAERLRELKAKREEVVRDLAKLKPLFTVPPYLYKPETTQRFQERVREVLTSGSDAMKHVYLQNLLDHIVVGEESITIEVRAGAALAMMAASRPAAVESTSGEVLPDVVDWHARRDSCRERA